MAKLSDAELTAITQAELEKLMDEVKKRTKAVTSGVKIPDLAEAQVIDGTELLIIEGKNGTQRTSMNNLPITELINARDDGTTKHQNLKDRLDNMEKNTAQNATNIAQNVNNISDVAKAVNGLNREIEEAKTNDKQITYGTLKERMDSFQIATITANRPTLDTFSGMCVFDLDLNKPIWRNKDNNGWVDATGQAV